MRAFHGEMITELGIRDEPEGINVLILRIVEKLGIDDRVNLSCGSHGTVSMLKD